MILRSTFTLLGSQDNTPELVYNNTFVPVNMPHLFRHLCDAVARRFAHAVVVQLASHAVVVRHVLCVLAHHLAPCLAHEHAPCLLGEELHPIRKVVAVG